MHPNYTGLTGRQAPVKRCLARLKINSSNRNHRESQMLTVAAVWQLEPDLRGIARRHFDLFLQPAHPLRLLRAEQMPLAGVHAHDFSRRSDLETLGRSSMGLQLNFLSRFSRHNSLTKSNSF